MYPGLIMLDMIPFSVVTAVVAPGRMGLLMHCPEFLMHNLPMKLSTKAGNVVGKPVQNLSIKSRIIVEKQIYKSETFQWLKSVVI